MEHSDSDSIYIDLYFLISRNGLQYSPSFCCIYLFYFAALHISVIFYFD